MTKPAQGVMNAAPTNEIKLTLEGHIIEGQTLDQSGHDIRVTIISGGTSKNGYHYDDPALQHITRMMEGAHAYADHSRSSADLATRSVRDVVGFYHNAQFVPGSPSRVDATRHIFEAASWLWSLIQEAFTLGKPNLIGLSIDIYGNWQVNESTRAKHITDVVSLNSCDIVTRPSAGGKLNRILHDDSPDTDTRRGDIYDALTPNPTTPPKGDSPSMDPTTQTPQIQAEPNASPANGANSGVDTPSNATGLSNANSGTSAVSASHILEQQRVQIEQMLAEARLQRAELLLERRLQESILPGAVKEQQ